MNFILSSMTDLPYFIPLVVEGNRRNVKSKFFLTDDNRKYNSPYIDKNCNFLLQLQKNLNFNLFHIGSLKLNPGLTFSLEGVGSNKLEKIHNGVVLTRLTDFTVLYKQYIDNVNYVVFPSKFIAKYYDEPWIYPIGNEPAGNTFTDKNLYLGCPKYDIIPNKENIFKKIKEINDKSKYCLVVAPQKDLMTNQNKFQLLIKTISDMGYKILVKARGKDPAPNYFKGDHYFEDSCWYPHDTMDLLTISDFYVNFGSTVVKEGIMLNRPSINFELKKFRHFDFLFDQSFNVSLDDMGDVNKIKESIEFITKSDFKEVFDDVKKKYLHPMQNSSKKILDFLKIGA